MARMTAKLSQFEGGRRPWNVNTKPARTRPETERERLERETCLSCQALRCPSLDCPLGELPPAPRKRKSKMKIEIPENFRYYGRIETIQELSRRYQVGHNLISQWRKELGITREKG